MFAYIRSAFVVAAAVLSFSAAAVPTTQAQAEAKLKTDFISFVNNPVVLPNAGDSMPWAGGVITRNAQRQLIYTTAENGFSQFNLTQLVTDPVSLAQYGGAGLKRLWAEAYGVDVSRVPGVQNMNREYWLAALVARRPGGIFNLGGNGSVTATLYLDGAGNPSRVVYEGKSVTVLEFQATNWFRSLTGVPGF